MTTEINTAEAMLNGNRFVNEEHVFVPGNGCFFPSLEVAKAQGCSPNGVGLWVKSITFADREWFKAGNLNVWD